MKRAPLLTVCVITYNHARYIEEAIDSFLNQQVDFDWQLVIADDHSTDGTRDILQRYKKQYPDRIHLILQTRNYGPEKNWLDLVSYPATKYVLYAEADDYVTDLTKLQRQVDFLEAHPDCAICFHPVRVVYEGEDTAEEIFPTPEHRSHKKILGMDDLLATNFMQTNSVMYRWAFTKKSVREAFPPGITPGDWYLHLLHAQTGKIGFIDRVMSVYRRHPGGLWWDSHHNLDAIWQKHGLAHLRFYVAALALCGDNASRRATVQAQIYRLFDNFVQTDARHGTHIFNDASTAFPELIAGYALYKQEELVQCREQLAAEQKTAERLRQDKQDLTWHYEAVVKQKEQELTLIKNSRFWRLRSRAVRIVRRDAGKRD